MQDMTVSTRSASSPHTDREISCLLLMNWKKISISASTSNFLFIDPKLKYLHGRVIVATASSHLTNIRESLLKIFLLSVWSVMPSEALSLSCNDHCVTR